MSNKSIYFVGIGGIGMSALARYFMHEGYRVGGYDRTPSFLTEQLAQEGASVHYEDNIELIGEEFRDPATTRVIYTPAVPADHSELCYFREGGFEVRRQLRDGCCGYARQDHHIDYGGVVEPPRGRMRQGCAGRYLEELREQPSAG